MSTRTLSLAFACARTKTVPHNARRFCIIRHLLVVKPLKNISETGREMVRLSVAFRDDMAAYATASIPEVFGLLQRLPYRNDPEGVEFLQRPYYTLNGIGSGGDCDDKAICVGAWAALRR